MKPLRSIRGDRDFYFSEKTSKVSKTLEGSSRAPLRSMMRESMKRKIDNFTEEYIHCETNKIFIADLLVPFLHE